MFYFKTTTLFHTSSNDRSYVYPEQIRMLTLKICAHGLPETICKMFTKESSEKPKLGISITQFLILIDLLYSPLKTYVDDGEF